MLTADVFSDADSYWQRKLLLVKYSRSNCTISHISAVNLLTPHQWRARTHTMHTKNTLARHGDAVTHSS